MLKPMPTINTAPSSSGELCFSAAFSASDAPQSRKNSSITSRLICSAQRDEDQVTAKMPAEMSPVVAPQRFFTMRYSSHTLKVPISAPGRSSPKVDAEDTRADGLQP